MTAMQTIGLIMISLPVLSLLGFAIYYLAGVFASSTTKERIVLALYISMSICFCVGVLLMAFAAQ